MLVKQID